MITVGITGGIGSGKSTFCRFWEDEGIEVLYLDDLAKKIMIEDQQLISKIKQTFGDTSYYEDGTLNRQYLAREAFEKDRVEDLNALVHPVLWKYLDKVISKKRDQGAEIFALEAAILLNKGRPERVDQVVIIESDPKEQIDRVRKRDNITDDQDIISRMSKQPDFSKLHHLADHVVENNGSIDDLKRKALNLLNELYKVD